MPARVAVASLLLSTLLFVGARALADSDEDTARQAARPQEGPGRDYQRDSVESFTGRVQQAASWVKERLSGFHVTPARLMAGLGLLGVLLTWNKNKRKATWAALAGFAWLLLLGGLAAILTGWRALA